MTASISSANFCNDPVCLIVFNFEKSESEDNSGAHFSYKFAIISFKLAGSAPTAELALFDNFVRLLLV